MSKADMKFELIKEKLIKTPVLLILVKRHKSGYNYIKKL